MDPIDFIDSKDVREYLRKIGYECGSVEASYLIWQCNGRTLEEKHEAWQWIINNTKDVPVPKGTDVKGWDSLHRMLADYMRIEDEMLLAMRARTGNDIYIIESYGLRGLCGVTRSYDQCFSEFQKFLESCLDPYDGDFNIRASKMDYSVHKYLISDAEGLTCAAYANFNSQGQLMYIRYLDKTKFYRAIDEAGELDQDVLYRSFMGMGFDIPTPFKIGDILRDCLGGHPTVVDHIPSGRIRNWNDSIDVYSFDSNVYGLTTDLLYEMIDEEPCEDECVHKLRAEYYREELMGKDRALAAYSSYLNKELSYSEFLRYAQAFSCEYIPLEEGCIPSKIKVLISGDTDELDEDIGRNVQQ